MKKYAPLYSKHEFWDKQPMKKTGLISEGQISEVRDEEIKQEPYALPDGYLWTDLNLDDHQVMEEVY